MWFSVEVAISTFSFLPNSLEVDCGIAIPWTVCRSVLATSFSTSVESVPASNSGKMQLWSPLLSTLLFIGSPVASSPSRDHRFHPPPISPCFSSLPCLVPVLDFQAWVPCLKHSVSPFHMPHSLFRSHIRTTLSLESLPSQSTSLCASTPCSPNKHPTLIFFLWHSLYYTRHYCFQLTVSLANFRFLKAITKSAEF